MENGRGFFDADMERLLGGETYGEDTAQYAFRGSGNKSKADAGTTEYHKTSGSSFYDPQMEEMLGGMESAADERSSRKNTVKRDNTGGSVRSNSFSSSWGGQSHENNCWEPPIHGENEVNAFGGWFFRAQDESGQSVIRLVMSQMSVLDENRANEWYGMLGRMPQSHFLHRTGSSPAHVNGHVVFDFEINECMLSFGEMHRQGEMNSKNPVLIFRKLNEIIMEYRLQLAKMGRTYQALNCLTVDTVFMDPDNRMMVLPVFYSGRNYPVEIAREATIQGQKTDERSDLYAAAYVAVETYSDSVGDKPLRKPDVPAILECLQPVREWRPSPEEVSELLHSGSRPRPTPVWPKPRIDLSRWVSSWKGLEEREDTFDTNETVDPAEEVRSSRRSPVAEGDDSWYEEE